MKTIDQNRYHVARKVTLIGMIVNTALAILKVIIGIVGHSPALFADGIHSFSDLISDVMVLFAAKHANKGADNDHPYGHERIETLATLVLSVVLVVVGIAIAWHAVDNWLAGEAKTPDQFTLYAALISIFANEWLFRYTLHVGNRIESDLIRANAWHHRSDMLSSAIVLFGILGAIIGFGWMDALAAIIVAYLIIKMGARWGYRSLNELIDEGVDEATLSEIDRLINAVEGVRRYHCLRTRKMAGKIMLDVHILVDRSISASEGHYIAEKVRSVIVHHIENMKDITVHVDVVEHPEEISALEKLPPSRAEIVTALKAHLAKHGLDDAVLNDKIILYYFPAEIRIVVLANYASEQLGDYKRVFEHFTLRSVKKTRLLLYVDDSGEL
ncbi:MAG: cation diffusion facilitator family transporter [Francisellaceae bacterium]